MPNCAVEIEEIPEDSSLENNAPIIATVEPEKKDTEIVLDTKSIKSELSSKYSGLKKSVRTELAYLKAFSEQQAPCLRPGSSRYYCSLIGPVQSVIK